MEFLATHHLLGLMIGVCTFLIIGLFHPLVVRAEYHWGAGCWWIFGVVGVVAGAGSVWTTNVLLSAVLGVLAFSSLWTIRELFEQRQRVLRGWFPSNPKRNKSTRL